MINAIINGGEQSQYQLLQSEWMDRAKWSLAASGVYKRYSSIDEKRSSARRHSNAKVLTYE